MSWQLLLKQKAIEHHKTSLKELDELRGLIERDLKDAEIEALSLDSRFALAYSACLLLAKMIIGCAGYRTRGHGAHRATFEALETAMGSNEAALAAYLSDCRRKRNKLTYTSSGVISETEVAALLKEATGFRKRAEDWIAVNYPQFSL